MNSSRVYPRPSASSRFSAMNFGGDDWCGSRPRLEVHGERTGLGGDRGLPGPTYG